MIRTTPLGALGRGLLAGFVGSGAQSLFFAATRGIAPTAPRDVFPPPEPAQAGERATETVARRFFEGLIGRHLPDDKKAIAAQAVHYLFGAGWGGLFGMARASAPRLRGPLGALGFATFVWIVGDELLLPAARLSAWPHRYPWKNHAYAFAAHLAYGAAVYAACEALRPRTFAGLAAGFGLLRAQRRGLRLVPRPLRRLVGVRPVVTTAPWLALQAGRTAAAARAIFE